eukprot:TRINITY_DN10662_c0_g1_i1.p1 TRINITY_DN10662_c0_g1~~TRINITY_DN10662_c0_g1_i1.p1  ORF type:complete len:407 (+),score=88.38 TRINITY_DN10662_c0_g1_i1:112-1332(+)
MGSLDAYELIENIGKGTFGTVSKIRRKSDQKVLVWKQMDYGKMGEKEKQQLVQEVNLLQKLRHANIVRYYDRIIDRENTTLFIVMEYCEGGDIATLIKKCRKERTYIDEEVIWKTFMQILMALSECHKKPDGVILHRDIKPGNIFLDAEKNVKLGDFGLARVLGENSLFAHTFVGTPFYMSPEQICGCAYNEKCDIWSLGCLIYEMAALYPPFEAPNQYLLSKKIKEGKFARIPKNYSDDLQKVIERMVNVNRTKRADIEELLATPQVAIRTRERKITQHYNSLKKKEEELRKREMELDDRERIIAAREQMVAAREADLSQRYLEPAVGRMIELGRAVVNRVEVDTLAETVVDLSMSGGMDLEKENAMVVESSKAREMPARHALAPTGQLFRDMDNLVRRSNGNDV